MRAFLMENSISDSTFRSVELLFVLVVSFVRSQTDHYPTLDPRPRNVSYAFDSGNPFCLMASWAPPDAIEFCKDPRYEYFTSRQDQDIEDVSKELVQATSSDPIYLTIDGRSLEFSVQTRCDDIGAGEPVVLHITATTNPKLVHDFQCALHSQKDANCSWTPTSRFPDLQLFYWIARVRPDLSYCPSLRLVACEILPHQDNVRRVCHISVADDNLHDENVYFLFQTRERKWNNTFHWHMNKNVTPPALEWTLEKRGDKLNIRWTPPKIKLIPDWEYVIDYTQCNIRKSKLITGHGVTSYDMPIDPDCQYRIKLKATQTLEGERTGETPWSDEKQYGENVSSHMINAAIIALLLVAIISFLAFCAVRKYKEQIFPRVPEPKDFLQDILDNNNKGPAEKLYVPAEETEDAKFCLVLEPDHELS